jgi:acetyl-CoA C-acetyltransferase
MRRVAVVGVGMSAFGVRNDVTIQELVWEAVRESLDDSGLEQKDIELSVVGTVNTRGYELMPAVVVNEYSGLTGRGL